ncbi:MAG: hydroxymethylglutaryl-CoA synthase family protein [Sandaracinus sp.]|nr:hydroxymethylglutaryl-CoA synthase family protein [Sandaracinus sp.]MCB9615891.1 hydroxymethylglutaryl-CoA synthase family protein [Sandaracinus sp.]MCB9624382.1 hydroxymethylglutaryl-CoA synthase family protein [Sandaracinus sp.]
MALVGIDAVHVWASTLGVSFREVAAARGIDAKSFASTRFEQRSLLPLWEDPVTLAVNAARPVVAEVGADRVGLLIVATESGLDFGKPLSTWVHRHLGLGTSCRNFEIKHACFGGTAALMTAASYVRERPERVAIVVMTDVARDHVGDPAELTAGSGAVALAVSTNPRILALDPETGSATREVYDVARPRATGEHNDAVLSLYSYLDLVELAWADYVARTGGRRGEGDFSHLLFHTPLWSLAERAHAALLEAADEDVEPEAIADSFARRVAPSLAWNLRTANVYSGSVYVSLAGLLATSDVAPGSRLALFSYGSGACSELFSGVVQSGARAAVLGMDVEPQLDERRMVDVATYEALVKAHQEAMVATDFVPDLGAPAGVFEALYAGRGRLVLESVRGHERTYRDA